MKRWSIPIACAAVLALSAPAFAEPQVGYVYPAGGQQGTTFTVEVGGQSLWSVDGVRVSGDRVRASVVEYVGTLDNNELRDIRRFLPNIVKRRWIAGVMDQAEQDGAALPDHPWLRDLDEKSPAELARLNVRLFDEKAQPNAQIAEKVILEVTIAPDAEPGDRELRLVSPDGLSNPLCFQVGVLPELREVQFAGAAGQVVEPPALLNGQIMPGEVDRIRIHAREGQRLVIRLHARRLIPYLADAVPGWFQATMALYDSSGREVAYADDFRFDPDPLLLVEVPEDGVYELEVRDAIYRGRDDFVYRISVGELPFVTRVFPLGAQVGAEAVVEVAGWNLPADTLPLDTVSSGSMIREADFGEQQALCRGVCYAVDTLPEATEAEPNDGTSEAQAVGFPVIVNGRIDRPGDADVFAFEGRVGEEIVAEVYARRLSSPLDSVLRIRDASGAEVALNDDHKDPLRGLITHHADSKAQVTLPADGTYTVTLRDARRAGGDAHAYRLHIRPAQPDFALRLVPSAINVQAGRAANVEIHALRREGFEGEITLALTDAPEGFTLNAPSIAPDQEKVEATISAPRGAKRQVTPISVEGRAVIDGEQVARPAVPAEDMMQAFLWRFLVQREELLVAVTGTRPVPAVWQPLVLGMELASDARAYIPLGETAQVRVKAPDTLPDNNATALSDVKFRLSNRPRGVTLRGAELTAEGVALTFKADRNIAVLGDRPHAIVEVCTDPPEGRGDATMSGRVSLGVLPAIPLEITRP